MIENVYYAYSDNINPYHNQALQHYLFNNIPDNSMVFMLWKNNDSVIVSSKQSVYNEVNIQTLELEHTNLCRSETTGSAIFNDLGSLNYAFFVYQNNYNIVNQINVIYQALRQLNLPVYLSEENEIMLNKTRITDNFYLAEHEKCMHTGSLYWDCDKKKRTRLLKEHKNKVGVGNITDEYPLIRAIDLEKKILQSLADRFGAVYRLAINDVLFESVEYFHSYKYIYKPEQKYNLLITNNFEIGKLQIYVDMLDKHIEKVDVYMDEENYDFVEFVKYVFKDLLLDDVLFNQRLDKVEEKYKDDIIKIYKSIKKEGYCL